MKLHSLLQTAKQGIKKIDKGKATKGKSDHGSKRKAESEIALTSDPKEAVCFYCNTKGHWKRSYPKYLKDLKDGKVKKGSHSGSCKRGEGLLDLVHTDVCRPFRSATKDGKRYYVTFTDDFSIYGYVYLIKHKSDTFKVFKRKGKLPTLGHIKIWGCEVYVRREAQDKLEARSEKCLFVGFPEESFGYLFYKPKDNVVFVAQRGVFLEREMISKRIVGMDVKTAFLNRKLTEDVCGTTRSEDESCIYVKVSGSVVVFLVLYVDDILLIGNNIPTLQSVKDWLGKCFAMKDLGDAAYILGIKIYRDRSKRLIGLSQDTYLDKFLKRFKMEKSKKWNLPLHHDIKISKDLCPKTDKELDKMSRVPYALVVGSIMYAMTCTRHDVSFALSMFMVKKKNSGGAMTWKSSKQDTVAGFTCESGYIAACEASKEAI
uniref:Retrotransposon protein, putative, Ty1-copia subclass n=1 Tax=Tanacetum cinerariifolium TaxID=118510 RepID=A0A699HHM5_TANCI|nr:retrotransposon protein, putative, Ty1-copia subclass [Tanacetum cinerariifolium]